MQHHNLAGIDSRSGAIYSTGDRPIVMAKANARTGFLTIRRRSHGTYSERSVHVTNIVSLLDPEGTTFQRVE